jgi:hypothetical protein
MEVSRVRLSATAALQAQNARKTVVSWLKLSWDDQVSVSCGIVL